MRISTGLAREDENVNCQTLEIIYETFTNPSNVSCFMRSEDRELNFFSLILRQQEDLSRKLQECQSLLGEVEPLVSGRSAQRIKEMLVSVFVFTAGKVPVTY